MKLLCMIVDDDVLARKALQRLCAKSQLLQLEAVCSSAEEALDKLQELEIDLIFLDIHMPEISGIDFLERLSYLPQIIITTAKVEYAYEAFEYQVTDFLKKPISIPRFLEAVEKARRYQEKLLAYRAHPEDVYIRQEGKYIRLELEKICYFENVGDYVRIKTDETTFIIHSTLKNIDEKLNDPRFLKVHRSYIVNLSKIKDIEENTLVIDKTVIPISRTNRPILMARINVL